MTFLFCLLIILKYLLIPIIAMSLYVGWKNRSVLLGFIVFMSTTLISAVFGCLNLMLFVW